MSTAYPVSASQNSCLHAKQPLFLSGAVRQTSGCLINQAEQKHACSLAYDSGRENNTLSAVGGCKGLRRQLQVSQHLHPQWPPEERGTQNCTLRHSQFPTPLASMAPEIPLSGVLFHRIGKEPHRAFRKLT